MGGCATGVDNGGCSLPPPGVPLNLWSYGGMSLASPYSGKTSQPQAICKAGFPKGEEAGTTCRRTRQGAWVLPGHRELTAFKVPGPR